jgi:hypothetical protein
MPIPPPSDVNKVPQPAKKDYLPEEVEQEAKSSKVE